MAETVPPTTPPVTRLTVEHFLLRSIFWVPRVLDNRMASVPPEAWDRVIAGSPFAAVYLIHGFVRNSPSDFISDRMLSRTELRNCHDAMLELESAGLIECLRFTENRMYGAKITPTGEERLNQLDEATP